MQAAPSQLVKGEVERVLPWVIEAILGLAESPLVDVSLLLGLLLVVSEVLMDPKGKLHASLEKLPSQNAIYVVLVDRIGQNYFCPPAKPSGV